MKGDALPTAPAFDLVLAYPQWQGSGRHENLPRGAQATAELCSRFGPVVSVPVSTETASGHGVHRWGAIFEQFRAAHALLTERRPERLLTAGGDCASDVASIGYLATRYPDLTVIWIDAHLDANTPDTSPSGNFHGMPVSAIMGHAPAPMRELLTATIDPRRFYYFGTRMADPGDLAFQSERGLATLDPDRLVSGPVHVHFDLDVLDPTEFPWLAYREPNGLSVDRAIKLLRKISGECELVGFTLTEFAPADANGAQAGARVIARLIEATRK